MGGHQMIVQTLLDNGADINQLSANNRRYTPLLSTSLFSENGRSIAQVLIDHGADVNVRRGQGRSFFHDACRYGCLSILESVSLEEIKSAGRVSAAQNGPNFRGWENIGCFHWAALGDQQNVGSFLLANGLATVDEASNGEQMAALHIAGYHGSTAFVDFLLDAGASLNPKNSAGQTPFYMALCRAPDRCDEATDSQRGSCIRRKYQDHRAGGGWVAGWGNLEAMSVLQQADRGAHMLHELSLSAALDGRHRNGTSVVDILTTVLKYAIEQDKTLLCKQILDRAPDLSKAMDECGKCGPLLYALRLKRRHIARMLVTSGANIEEAVCVSHETFGFDAAHYAVMMGDDTLLRLLFQKGYRCLGPFIQSMLPLLSTSCIAQQSF
ncbi:ankyrin repeat-containing domain protein [Leptodontidium sp. MPI-SDFR-AT-0119]|nr:ankyrin repeat-containing domain protein [Leptodontidium sp. MPI-SDFR-AT-0119]